MKTKTSPASYRAKYVEQTQELLAKPEINLSLGGASRRGLSFPAQCNTRHLVTTLTRPYRTTEYESQQN